jgi:hypothetical protein
MYYSMVGSLHGARGGGQKMKKTVVMIFWVVTMLMIWGCEPKADGSWTRPQGSVADFQKDREECINQATEETKKTKENFDLLVSKCMQSKGYYFGKNP